MFTGLIWATVKSTYKLEISHRKMQKSQLRSILIPLFYVAHIIITGDDTGLLSPKRHYFQWDWFLDAKNGMQYASALNFHLWTLTRVVERCGVVHTVFKLLSLFCRLSYRRQGPLPNSAYNFLPLFSFLMNNKKLLLLSCTHGQTFMWEWLFWKGTYIVWVGFVGDARLP